jgi:hypothetical protein
MPNNIENCLQVIGDNEKVQKVFAAIKNATDKLEIDFNKIRPMPKNAWHHWAIANWGTKWNAYGQGDDRNTNDTIYFLTAWGPPSQLIEELSKMFPLVKFDLRYDDIEGGSAGGKMIFENGKLIEFIPLKEINDVD